MNAIRGGACGNNLALEQVTGQGLGALRFVQQRNAREHCQPGGGHFRVANRHFVQDFRGSYPRVRGSLSEKVFFARISHRGR
jgi:hypothetical protein